MKKVRTLTDVLNSEADELIRKWADQNKTVVWLGKKSRDSVRDDVAIKMRWAYDFAKKKYGPKESDECVYYTTVINQSMNYTL